MTKILLIGDIHGKIEEMREITRVNDSVDFALQTGDMEVYGGVYVPTYFIRGNHDDYKMLALMNKGNVWYENLKLIPTGLVISIHGINIGAINGNYSPIYKPRIRHFTREDVESCMNMEKVDIFLTHEAPMGIGLRDKFRELGIPPITDIVNKIKPKYVIFGHHHVKFDKEIKGIRYIGMPYGFEEYAVLDYNEGVLEWRK